MQKLKRYLKSSPFFFLNYHKLKSDTSKLVVDRNTKLVVEGFPRCANSYTVHLIEYLIRKDNVNDFKIGHHLHSIAQVKRAKSLRIPCVILIREPDQAIASFLLRNSKLSISHLLQEYLHFYNYILKTDFDLVLIDFKEIINDANVLIERVNNKFNFDLPSLEKDDKEHVVKLMARISKTKYIGDKSRYSTPNHEKDFLKHRILKTINDSNQKYLLNKAQNLYMVLKARYIN